MIYGIPVPKSGDLMEVSSVIVERISVKSGKWTAKSKLYEFGALQWVTVGHVRKPGVSFGPASLISTTSVPVNGVEVEDHSADSGKIREITFPNQGLQITDQGPLLKEPWTLRKDSLFILELPPRYVASPLVATANNQHHGLMIGCGDNGGLFYYSSFMQATSLNLEVLLVQDDKKYLSARDSIVEPNFVHTGMPHSQLANELRKPSTWIEFSHLLVSIFKPPG